MIPIMVKKGEGVLDLGILPPIKNVNSILNLAKSAQKNKKCVYLANYFFTSYLSLVDTKLTRHTLIVNEDIRSPVHVLTQFLIFGLFKPKVSAQILY